MRRTLLIAALACALVPAGASAADLKLRGMLNATNVVSATESPATGEVRAMLQDDNDLRIDLIFSDLQESPTGAALHVGLSNENGALVQRMDLDLDATEDSGRVVGAELAVSDTVADRIRAGEAYVVITSIVHPEGIIRGQLIPQPLRLPEPPLADQ